MSAGHTPGPWEVDPDNNTFVRDVDGNMIADCDVCQYTDDGEIQLEDCPANARLVAAAPTLFEACEAALIFIANTRGRPAEMYRGKFRAAIALATGETE